MQLYFDYSATTPCRSEAIAAMEEVLHNHWGNPSSLHEWGQRSATALEQARMQVASLLHGSGESIVFTSGGTEANNLALWGVAQQYAQPQHMITSQVEHSAISKPMAALERQGWQITRLAVDRWGQVNPVDLEGALQANTVLISIIYGQSEVGTLQAIAELGAIARQRGILFHTDGVQVAGRIPIDVQTLPVDLLSLSSHKLYGPQGAGALYIRPGVDLAAMNRGGGQEMGLRSGTQALPAIVGFGVAAELASNEVNAAGLQLQRLRDRLYHQLNALPGLHLTGHPWKRLPHHLSFTVTLADGTPLSGKSVVRQLNLAGIGISSGSACQSGQSIPSPVLMAMGYDEAMAKSSIRLTLGRDTSEADIDWLALVLKQQLEWAEPSAIAPPTAPLFA
ncbi:cysteine desulfurase [Candidatus Synechococcus calcipolaris G9]|uniref:cysteine desulfurase n=1 Tax=Candidatus Synechococcus calcipolaris G9 TaxID=1497997 RepID=A0ABT6EZ27_9SYNE|nr:cysteine desulfurase family protein [Candidatus Synechococcus calcipolaris]MDG2990678.1 cysteine desulfurase [Candidatus Synechococcus calcipolaris G9]